MSAAQVRRLLGLLAMALLCAATACSEAPAAGQGSGVSASGGDGQGSDGLGGDSDAKDALGSDAVDADAPRPGTDAASASDAVAPDSGPSDTAPPSDASTADGVAPPADAAADGDAADDALASADLEGGDAFDGAGDGTSLDTGEEPPCQSALTSIADIPLEAVKVDFETCSDCLCCLPGGLYPAEIPLDCLMCGPAGALQKAGAVLTGGMLTTLVGCVEGNKGAPLANRATFIGSAYTTPSGSAGLQLVLQPPATMFGFSAVPTSSDAKPVVILRGYDANDQLVAQDAFDFYQAPGGSCATLNPAAQFFGFRPCFGAKLHKVIVEVSDANVAIDEVRIYRP